MRCPTCGATNRPDAGWCTQCYTRFGTAADERPDSEEPTPSGERPAADHAGTAGAAPPADESRSGRGVRERDGEVEWRCSSCGGWTPFGSAACATCGAPPQGLLPDEGRRADPVRRDRPVVAASALLPGLGHMLAGRVAAGVARAILALLWLVGGVTILVGATGAVARLPGVVLLLGAAALWAGTLVDAAELARGGTQELLSPRALLWLVVGVTGLLLVALAGAAMAGVSPG
jgi:hypothetical protein